MPSKTENMKTYLECTIEAAKRLKYLWFAEYLGDRFNDESFDKLHALAVDIFHSHEANVSDSQHDLEWFLSNIGNRVFRNKVKCDCESCRRGGEEGILIADITHANYLFDVQNELGIRYTNIPPIK